METHPFFGYLLMLSQHIRSYPSYLEDVSSIHNPKIHHVAVTGVTSLSFSPRHLNPLNAELNPICYVLALLAHHFLHVSRIRVKSLILRLLMSYIYMERLFLMFLDHTQRRSTVGRNPLDEWSARRRDLYLTTHDTHNRQIPNVWLCVCRRLVTFIL